MVYDVCAAVISDLSVDARVWKEVRSIRASGRSVRLIGCRYDITHAQQVVQDDIDVIQVPLGRRRGRSSKRDRATALLAVWRAICETHARVYHSHNIHVMPACWLAAQRAGAQFVYDAHELYGNRSAGVNRGEGTNLRSRVLTHVSRRMEGFAVDHADVVITTNPSRALALQARHGLRDIEVLANVPNLIDVIEPWDPGYPHKVPILLYQGGIYAQERPFRQAIQALRFLSDVHLVIVGFGRDDQIDLIRRWARETDVTERVHLLPPVPFDRLVATAALATVGLVPLAAVDLNYLLGDTNKLHEYLMAGLPVIASDLPEVRRVATQGNPPVGELFDACDPASIADAYKRIVRDPETYRRRREEARRIAVERHHWAIEEQRLVDIYDGLIGPSIPGSADRILEATNGSLRKKI
jgi:glycosyltransferase involved in cell wall biosynthesis